MNYFEYFSEIEERFSRRRGSILLLNTLDWALIETWREAGIPLPAVLRGIDAAFDKYEARAARGKGLRKVNGLAWCAQAVMESAEELVEASTGLAPAKAPFSAQPRESGFETERVAAYLERNASTLEAAPATPTHRSSRPEPSQSDREDEVERPEVCRTTAQRLRELATTMRSANPLLLDDLDRTLTVLEEKLFATLQSTATEAQLVDLKAQADRELAPYRAKISAVQLRQIQQQFLHKRLLESHNLPRLSLFYMGHSDMGPDA